MSAMDRRIAIANAVLVALALLGALILGLRGDRHEPLDLDKLLIEGVVDPLQNTAKSHFYERFDEDLDGRITRDEYLSAGGTPEDFSDLDLDGSGELLRFELRRSLRLVAIRSVLDGWDANKDGVVSRSEFAGTRTRFERMGGLTDGGIDLQDVEEAIRTRALRRTPGATEMGIPGGKYLKQYDLDKDDRLSEEEFPGGSATFAAADTDDNGFLDEIEVAFRPEPGKKRTGRSSSKSEDP
jgi:hypothetical protein